MEFARGFVGYQNNRDFPVFVKLWWIGLEFPDDYLPAPGGMVLLTECEVRYGQAAISSSHAAYDRITEFRTVCIGTTGLPRILQCARGLSGRHSGLPGPGGRSRLLLRHGQSTPLCRRNSTGEQKSQCPRRRLFLHDCAVRRAVSQLTAMACLATGRGLS